MFYVGPTDTTKPLRPDFVLRCRGAFNWFGSKQTTGFELWKMEPGEGYVELYGGGIFNSDRIHTDGGLEVRGGGIFGGRVVQNADWSRVPFLRDLIKQAGCFNEALWKNFPYPYRDKDLADADFTFRESADYSTETKDAAWVESFWQRDLAQKGLVSWKDAKHSDESRPYPGRKKFSDSWWTYKEANIDRNGRPKSRDQISQEGGKWSQNSWDTIKVHPNR